jgi:hypothetical protein
MMFVQTAAPTGWTKSTTHDNKALRVVSGTASSGGSVAFTTAFASQAVSGTNASVTATNQAQTATNQAATQGGSVSVSGGSVGNTTLATSQIPSHNHTFVTGGNFNAYTAGANPSGITAQNTGTYNGVSNTGGGGSHNHGFTTPTANFSGNSHNHTQDSHNHTQNAHTHTFTGTAIDLAVQYVDVIIATKD